MCRCVGSPSGGRPRRKLQPALDAKCVRHRADKHAAGTQHPTCLGDDSVGEAQVLEELARDHRVEARIRKRERRLDVGLDGLDPELRRLRERDPVDVEADDLVPVEEVPRERSRAAAEVEHPLAAPDRGLEERDALRHEDEVALVPALPMMLFVALAEIGHAELTAASWPSEAIVRRSPSSSSTSGSQPSSCFARVMSG